MHKASKKAQTEKKYLKPYQETLDKYKINIDQLENFCELIKSHSKYKQGVIPSKMINKDDFKELFEYISAKYKDKIPMKKRDAQRGSYLDKDIILNANAAENPNIMKELAKNFHNFSFYWKLNNPEELIEEWNQKVDGIQNRIHPSIFSINDSVEVIDEYDHNDEYICFGDWFSFW